ncbi:telethonin [Lepisosteus oculatus]|uniref:Titin-cap (telethonin) n=1 Tax=Lepisosteus oculatus TaxID=7918 RepID=W5N4V7_LEPOC|nr:PREDICTED: telethonin [Lepisosteus oculatus]
MQGRTVLVKRAGTLARAELGCSVREENRADRESYSADWQSVRLITQPQDRQSLHAVDECRRESLTRQWEARPLVQHCPSGVLRLGTVAGGVREYQLPYRNTLPVPLFAPAELGARLGRGSPHEEEPRPAVLSDGACPTKRALSDIKRDLPPITQPVRMDFAKAPRSLGRSMSQEAQRG